MYATAFSRTVRILDAVRQSSFTSPRKAGVRQRQPMKVLMVYCVEYATIHGQQTGISQHGREAKHTGTLRAAGWPLLAKQTCPNAMQHEKLPKKRVSRGKGRKILLVTDSGTDQVTVNRYLCTTH